MFNTNNIKFGEYKSFVAGNSIEKLGKVNVFIGKNNSGKSSCLEIIEYIVTGESHSKSLPKDIYVCQKITKKVVTTQFRANSFYEYESEYDYGVKFVDKDFWYSIRWEKERNDKHYVAAYTHEYNNFERGIERANNWNALAGYLFNGIENLKILKISAERNIYPEDDAVKNVLSTGEGVTSKIGEYINESSKDESIIENELLRELNKIISPDSSFSAIKVQRIPTENSSKWEIYLTENGNRFALSKMGSGLKTIIMVLLNLIVLKKECDNKCIFLFEELENNLHPALQRKLFEYIYDCAYNENLTIFLTTHSHVAINTFFDKECASIYHVEKNNNVSTIHKVENYIDKVNILDDLDIRASDLFQSNGIIWVEGPSDRVYIKKWIELRNKDIIENKHYQFAYYGGRLLSHYTAEMQSENLISVLLTNRNSAIIMDSDKISEKDDINETKKRVKNEFEQNKLFCWITKGKEIENYLLENDISKLYKCEMQKLKLYTEFPEYIKKQKKSFPNKKVEFAQEITEMMDEDSLNKFDLKEKIDELIEAIKNWNCID